MSILIPANQEASFPARAEFAATSGLTATINSLLLCSAEFASVSDFTAVATNTLNENVIIDSVSDITALMGIVQDVQSTFASISELTANAQLNNEPNVFPAAELISASVFTASQDLIPLLVAQLFSVSSLTADMDAISQPEFGFTILVDILDAGIQDALTPLSGNIRRVTARLLISGIEIPIVKATLSSPHDRLGTELTVLLAKPDVGLVQPAQAINFDLGIWVGGAWKWVRLLRDGRLSQRGARYVNESNLPKDSVELSIVDVMGDRWNRAPRKQLTYYDSQKIDAPDAGVILSQTVYQEDGKVIAPEFIPIANLSLKQALEKAYVVGCEFSKIVTNIPSFPIEQVNFTMSGGYDAGIRPLLSSFSPIFFEVDNVLWIIDPDAPLPTGILMTDFLPKFSVDIDDRLPPSGTNALIARLADNAGYETFTERVEFKTTSSGQFGTPGFTQHDTETRIREYRNTATPLKIEREEVLSVKTRTLDTNFNVISVETRIDKFDALRRRSGYTQTIEMLLPDLNSSSGALLLQQVMNEDQTIYYSPDPHDSTQDIQNRMETRVSGLILVDRNKEYLGKPYRIPYLDAHKSGYIDSTGEQSTEFGAIRTITEQMRFNGSQVQYETRVTNHVVNVPDRITVKTLPGNPSVVNKQGVGFRNVLLTIANTEIISRRVAEFDATNLPADLGLKLARRRLNNLNVAPKEVIVNMSFVNPVIRKGSVISLHGRFRSLGAYIINGSMIEITSINLAQCAATMSITGRELKP